MRANTSPHIRVKAAGGVRTLDALLAVMELGVTRIGATATRRSSTTSAAARPGARSSPGGPPRRAQRPEATAAPSRPARGTARGTRLD